MKQSTDLTAYLVFGWIGYAVAVDHGIRPTRAECRYGPRPCGWVGCRMHLANEETDRGEVHWLPVAVLANRTRTKRRGSQFIITIKDPEEFDAESLANHMEAHGSCALDIARDSPGLTLSDVGEKICVTRERVRQHEVAAINKIRSGSDSDELELFMEKED